ncbi:MAG: thiamine pyrophosphate-binding protein [Nitrospirota bacterium]|jgi:indolepyruvate decarboxylase
MKARMPLGDFMVAYLKKIGVTHLFGIPGDLVIKLFFRFGKPRGLKIVTLSHEPSVGFAADAYARSTGRFGVVCVTYGAGGHNIVNPVAGAYAEKVPLLVVSGGPGEEEVKPGTLIHHQAKEIESQHRIFREITCAAKVIKDPLRAAAEIDEVIRTAWVEHRPGYLEIHRDMAGAVIPVPREIIKWDGDLPVPLSDRRKVQEAARETVDRFNQARRPVLIGGIEIHRYKLMREIVHLAEAMGAPVATSILAKGVFPMDHPLHMGVYAGPLSPPRTRRRIESADLVLDLGSLLTDIETGAQPPEVWQARSIWAVDNRVNVSFHTYTQVALRDYVREILKQPIRAHREKVVYSDHLPPARPGTDRAVRMTDVLREINVFLAGRRNYVVLAESGDAIFGGVDVRVPGGGLYLAQGFYASMGFAVPGALGAQIGSGLRPLVLCGDGAFQMTGPEVSHAARYGLNPIVVLLNNGGWGIFHPVTPRKSLLKLPPWPYAELAKAWGGAGFRARTVAEFRDALAKAEKARTFSLIEVPIAPGDLSPLTRKYIRASARKAR